MELTERDGPVGRWISKDEVEAVGNLAKDARAGVIKADPLAIRTLEAFASKGPDGVFSRALAAVGRGAQYGVLGGVGTIIGGIGLAGLIGGSITIAAPVFGAIIGTAAILGSRSSLQED